MKSALIALTTAIALTTLVGCEDKPAVDPTAPVVAPTAPAVAPAVAPEHDRANSAPATPARQPESAEPAAAPQVDAPRTDMPATSDEPAPQQ